jgi:hypothetical protein
MKQQTHVYFSALALLAVLFSSCLKENLEEENEEEVITTLQLTFDPEGVGNNVVYTFDDPDGPGGVLPTQDSIILSPNKTYNVTLQLLNKTLTPPEDITEEVAAEPEAHRFYYIPGAGTNIAVSNLDTDPDGIPLGISSTWTTSAAATGTMKVVLRHYPGNPPDKAMNDPVNSPKSSTDVEIDFFTAVR